MLGQIEPMSQPTSLSHLETTLQPEIVGRLAVGHYLLSVGSVHGGLITSDVQTLRRFDSRSHPLIQVPRAFPGLLGRQTEVESAIAALQAGQTVEIYGQAGIGKSALLRHLAHHPQGTTSHPDGILYVSEHQPAADQLQTLFDAFYESHPDSKPTESEVRRALRDKQILILLDDRTLSVEEIQPLMAALPNSTFLIASQSRRFWGEGRAILLEGLSLNASLMLVERELGRSLTLEEKELVEPLWTLLKGHPQRLLQAAALMREDKVPLPQLLSQLQQEEVDRALTRMILASLPKTQRWIVAALVAMEEVGLLAEQIAAITGPPNPQPSLQALTQRHLVQMKGCRYCLSSSLIEMLREDFDPTPWMERVLAYLVPWVTERQSFPQAVLIEREVILYGIRWAVESRRPREALQLARSIGSALALGKQWKTWKRVLHWALQAAWTLEDQTAEAWALHELGTLALCQEDLPTAYDAFSQTLSLRLALRDEVGVMLTQHNQQQLKASTIPTPARSQFLAFGSQMRVYVALGVIALVVFGLAGWVGLTISSHLRQPFVEPTLAPAPNR